MSETAVMPITAKQAAELWRDGNSIQAFQVEGDPERQHIIYGVAFGMIEGDFILTESLADLRRVVPGAAELDDREFETAHSIAYVSMKIGWAKMVSQHVHRDSPAITIKKEKS
jgi:hypothetical protein